MTEKERNIESRKKRVGFAVGVATGALTVFLATSLLDPASKVSSAARAVKTYWQLAEVVPHNDGFAAQMRLLFSSAWNLAKVRPLENPSLLPLTEDTATEIGASEVEREMYNEQLQTIKLLDVYLQDCLRAFWKGRLDRDALLGIAQDLGLSDVDSLFEIVSRGSFDRYNLMDLADRWGLTMTSARLYFQVRYGMHTDALNWSHSMLK
jgi:hypothetical protein